jgi:hypothetical protein
MRCMACGEEMVLTAVMPDAAMMVEGFEQQTLTCVGCHATERRFVFGRRGATEASTPSPDPPTPPPPPPAPPLPTLPPPVSSSSQQPVPPCPRPEGIAPARAWTRAVEKLRSRQADLHARADATEKTNWNDRFNQAWEELAPTPRQPPPAAISTPVRQAIGISGRALRAQLRKMSPAFRRNRTQEPAAEPTAEAVQKFNQFWDSLAADRTRSQVRTDVSAAPALREPLPRSLSLVPVEALEAMGASSRAILLLRGTQQMGA